MIVLTFFFLSLKSSLDAGGFLEDPPAIFLDMRLDRRLRKLVARLLFIYLFALDRACLDGLLLALPDLDFSLKV